MSDRVADIVAGVPGLVFRRIAAPHGGLACVFLAGRLLDQLGIPAAAAAAGAVDLPDLLDPADRDRLAQGFARSARERIALDLEVRLRLPAGAVRWFEIGGQPRWAPDGSIVWDGVAIDVTRRRQRDARLQLIQQVSRSIAEAADYDAALGGVLRLICAAADWCYGEVWFLDNSGTTLVRGPVWHEDIAALAEFARRRRGRTYRHDENGMVAEVWRTGRYRWIEDLTQSLAGKPLYEDLLGELVLRTGYIVPVPAGGEVLAILVFQMFEHRAPDDEIFATVDAICRQLGTALQRKRIEQALQREAELLKSAQAVAELGVWTSDRLRTGRFTWSSEVYRIFGVTEATFDLRIETFLAMIHPDDRPRLEQATQRAIETGEPYALDHRIVRPDGTIRWVRERGGLVRDKSGTAEQLVGVCQDITDMRTAQERESRTERLAAVGALTGGFAHHFNNLLAVITGNVELLLESPGDAASVSECGQAALEAAERGAELTSHLLAYSRQQPLIARQVEVNALLAQLAGPLQRALGGTAIRLALEPTLPRVAIDPVQLEVALTNLVTNAAEAMAPGSPVRITTAAEGFATARRIGGTRAAAGDYVRIDIADTGTGIPAAIRARIFEPFFSTKPAGAGLGLSMVQGFMRQSGGHLEIDSTPGTGTVVRLYLPCTPPAQSGAPDR